MTARAAALLALGLAVPASGSAQSPPQTQTDDYTRYELLVPGSASFRILYDVTATTPGARVFYNAIREGAEEEVHSVTDLYTGATLGWELVDGAHARANGHPRASERGRYIKVELARPVPKGGQGRIRIDKTYRDPESYFEDGDEIVFSRSLGIRRNAVVLPPGYELVGCNYPCQVAREEDGRVKVSFMNPGPGAVPFRVRGRPLTRRAEWDPPSAESGRGGAGRSAAGARPSAAGSGPAPAGARPAAGPVPGVAASTSGARIAWTFPERAFEDRDITYFLLQPETHSFRLFHDYTETRAGVDRYLNVVRAGSRASDPQTTNLDTGESLKVETLRGAEIAARGIDIGAPATAESEVIVIWFDAVQPGRSVRLRILETYTDPGRYLLEGEELVWDRSFGRARNTVVLPEGWYLTANAIPGVIDETEDGRIRIRYVNPRPDQIRVFLTARRR